MAWTIKHGDALEKLREMPDNSLDSCVTDPPYGLEFMGKDWDGSDGFRRSLNKADVDRESVFGRASRTSPEYRAGHLFQEFIEAVAREIRRVLKPGAHLLAFGGSRTYHRMACAIEDAGFEIRDQIMWIYGSGFPKSRNLQGDRKGWGTALKPAHEPIVVARKPLIGTVAANVQKWGTGAINIDGCRIETPHKQWPASRSYAAGKLAGTLGTGGFELQETRNDGLGRWPANVITDRSEEVLAGFLNSESGVAVQRNGGGQKIGGNGIYGGSDGLTREDVGFGDSGSAARFFYCPKVDRAEREIGGKNNHPTVKPIELMQYLCRLVTPPNGTVLDPFAGSGSTGIAAVREGFNFVGVELNPEYVAIAQRRIEQDAPLFNSESVCE